MNSKKNLIIAKRKEHFKKLAINVHPVEFVSELDLRHSLEQVEINQYGLTNEQERLAFDTNETVYN